MLKNVYIGADSKGYVLKNQIIDYLKENYPDLHIVDLGVFRIEEQIEIPVLAREVGEKVVQNKPAIGILIDSIGSDLCDYSKLMDGLHPVLCENLKETELDDSLKKNILCVASNCTPIESATKIVNDFVENKLNN